MEEILANVIAVNISVNNKANKERTYMRSDSQNKNLDRHIRDLRTLKTDP